MSLKKLLILTMVVIFATASIVSAETMTFSYGESRAEFVDLGVSPDVFTISGITGTSDFVYTDRYGTVYPAYSAQSGAVVTVLSQCGLVVEELVDFHSEYYKKGGTHSIKLGHDYYPEHADYEGFGDFCAPGETVTLTEAGIYFVWAMYEGYYSDLPVGVIVIENSTAKYTDSKVFVNGKEIAFEAYNVSDNNYFKLRDIATAISGSEKQFDVSWDKANEAINLISDKAYTAVGGELAAGDGTDKLCKKGYSPIYRDGAMISPSKAVRYEFNGEESFVDEFNYLKAFNVNDNNYFKLRDIAREFDFSVEWSEETNSIHIDTSKPYTE